MPEGQFLYDKSGRPLMHRAPGEPIPPAKAINDPCPMCRNRTTQVLQKVNKAGKKEAHKRMLCPDCGEKYESPWDKVNES